MYMSSFSETICNNVEEFILLTLRLHPQCNLGEGDCWWLGVVSSWHEWASGHDGKPVTESAFHACLLGAGVPESAFSKPGAHTWVDLEHISFLYRTKHYKDGSSALILSPHFKGRRFHDCGHLFLEAQGDPDDLARMMLDLDRCIPRVKDVGKKALLKGYQERKVRSIRYEAAGVWLQDHFHGELPASYVGYEIADSAPGAADTIRLIFHEPDAPFWDKRYFDIPYGFQDLLQMDGVMDFVNDLDLRMGSLEMFVDEETGEKIPITRYEPFDYVYWEDENE